MLAASVALFGGVAYQYFVEGREKRKMKRLFGQYVSKDVSSSSSPIQSWRGSAAIAAR